MREELIGLLGKTLDMKEKLVELLKQTEINKINGHTALAETCFTPNVFENMATNLVAHGVTVQECKLGDKIYQTDGVRIYESTVGEITLTNRHTIFVTEKIVFDERAIGKIIFLSYAEAEAHLPPPPK